MPDLFRSSGRRLLPGRCLPERAIPPTGGVQRGSVMDMPLYHRRSAIARLGMREGARKLRTSEAKYIMKIPVLPISYADAQPLLENLGGPVAPEPGAAPCRSLITRPGSGNGASESGFRLDDKTHL